MKRVVVVFPGIGYHCDKPLLYFGRQVAGECGYEECVNLRYTFDGGNIRGNEKKMKKAFEVLYAQAEEQLQRIPFDRFEEILFLSKSVGTVISSQYAQIHGIVCRNVLYTPLKQSYLSAPERAAAFIGTADPWSNVNEVVDMSKTGGIPIHIYHGANHSLETGNVMENLKILEDVMDKTRQFLMQ